MIGIRGLFWFYRSADCGWYLMTRWGDVHFIPRKRLIKKRDKVETICDAPI